MPRETLVFIWMMLFPSAWLVAGLAWFLAARAAWPRRTRLCGELPTEAWRVYVIVAAVLVALAAAELYLWAFRFDYRAPVGVTGLVSGFGAAALAFAVVPLVAAACEGQRSRRAGVVAATLAVAGLAMLGAAPRLRAAEVASLVAAGKSDDAAVRDLVQMEGYGYLPRAEAWTLISAELADSEAVFRFASEALSDGVTMSRQVRTALADRLEGELETDGATTRGVAVAPLVWRLTADPAQTLRVYALAVPGLDDPGRRAASPEAQRAAEHGLSSPDAAVVVTMAEVLAARASVTIFVPELVDALAAHTTDPEPVGRLATTALLEEGSRRSLRAVLPRFRDPADPVWRLLRDHCPDRTTELIALTGDPDSGIRDGAAEVLAYVRQYCIRTRPVQG